METAVPSQNQISSQRNLSLECCKLIASFFVVFLHVPFPGTFGGLVSCLSRFGVPLFFAISGWFSYQTEPARLAKRFRHILLLELAGSAVYLCWNCLQHVSGGGSAGEYLRYILPTGQTLAGWLVLNVNPFSGHLWYLSAAALCYGVLWLWRRLGIRTSRPLYLAGICLMAAHFAMAEFSRFLGLSVPFQVYRSGLFFGLPMFTMGLFLREFREELLRRLTKKRLVLLLLGGIGLSLLEWQHFGGYDMHIGTIITVIALMLLTAACPQVPRWLEKPASVFGRLSTTIYLLHLLILSLYQTFVQPFAAIHLGQWEPWMQPVIVLAAALLTAAVCEWLRQLSKRLSTTHMR